MTLLDRYILGRFFVNFAILLALLYLFGMTIDLILALDSFVEASREELEEEGREGAFTLVITFIRLAVGFQGPRFFQFYSYLHGLVAIGGAAFTLAQMHRYREVTAILAAGVSMQRIAMPFVAGMFVLSLVQLANQEFIVSRVAPLLLRDHESIGKQSVVSFPVRFTPDGAGHLLQAPSFDPDESVLLDPTILVRDGQGRTVRRITAERALWGSREIDGVRRRGWILEGGFEIGLGDLDDASSTVMRRGPLGFHATDLTPRILIVRRYGEYIAMLSLRQIAEILDTPEIVQQSQLLEGLARQRYARFATVLVNVLVMFVALPAFLLREPANLLVRSMVCAGTALPALIGGAVFMIVDLPGIPPAVAVFLPVLVLMPIALGQWMYIKT